ncbi:MAG: hypothetical protein IPI43_27275 [Sandaracinaceae bacterium]|nr:hypothetical protein [Sandaracinaceae bacterium]
MIDIAMDDGASAMDARLSGRRSGARTVPRRIGAGAWARSTRPNTRCRAGTALKVPNTSQKTRRDAVSRFCQSSAASQIEHPHIVDVVNFVTDGPYMVLVMELLRGEPGLERLQAGRCPSSRRAPSRGSACEAEAATHAAGILHRDLKPAKGRPPFEGHNAFQLIWKHGNEPAPPLHEHARGVPQELSDVVRARWGRSRTSASRARSRCGTRCEMRRRRWWSGPSPPPLPSRRRLRWDARRGRCRRRCWARSCWAPRRCSPWTRPTWRPANRGERQAARTLHLLPLRSPRSPARCGPT